MSDAIVIESLTKDYGGFRAVDSLTLRVKEGSFVGFLGPNGSGKSTTIKMLTTLTTASEGNAYLDGVDVVSDPKRALINVGAVVETPEFYSYLTPEGVLAYIGRLRGMSRSDISQRTTEVLDIMKMDDVRRKPIGQFSKGMKQRVAIGQAMLCEPSILILDEPTSGLDPRGMVEVRQVLRDLRDEGLTVFMSSHLLNEVQEVCDHVAMLSNGKLVYQSSMEDMRELEGTMRIGVRTIAPMDDSMIDGLLGHPSVERISPTEVTLELEGDGETLNETLRHIDAQARVVSFYENGNPIESFYLSMIKESR